MQNTTSTKILTLKNKSYKISNLTDSQFSELKSLAILAMQAPLTPKSQEKLLKYAEITHCKILKDLAA